ncbi:somatotropin-like [Polypterus senegalus]|uniref:somatotropin-like n=1 Tax=Polypterus senegalus TaxID=55291 RepID=UPI0019642E73|nr:somatotropin-like [Polypterus senegalus]
MTWGGTVAQWIALLPSRVMVFAILLVVILNSFGHMGDAPKMKITRVVRNLVPRARHLHRLATDIYKCFERTNVPQEQRHSSKKTALCYSATILAPRNKEETLHKSVLEKRSDRHTDTYRKFEVILPADGSVVKVPGLLACFRKDAHRVATYLNLVTFRHFA